MKIKASHTPGPWSIVDGGEGISSPEQGVRVVNQLQGHVCSPNNRGDDGSEAMANANLIAAAPELLEAARLALSEFEISTETIPCDCHMLELRRAIAKAEGRKA